MKTRIVHCMQEKYDVYIGRPGIFGNPYSHKKGTRASYVVNSPQEAVEKYREYLLANSKLMEQIKILKGKTLGCWCKTKNNPDAPCHGDVIIEVLENE